MPTSRAPILALTTLLAVACSPDDKEDTSGLSSQASMSQAMSGGMTGGMSETSGTGAPTTTATSASGGDTSTGDATTTGPPPDPNTTGGPNTTASPDPVGTCCTPHVEPGCSNSNIQACVCGFDLNCCSSMGGGWDEICVLEVMSSGCGVCR